MLGNYEILMIHVFSNDTTAAQFSFQNYCGKSLSGRLMINYQDILAGCSMQHAALREIRVRHPKFPVD